ncbi:MAG: hypothetical protein NC201_04350 [Prevotella sp.]|nr:hypothetical protein [Bacteroides sp.]MCM1366460.1 hypothetical protein [Prevotella sp.]MCM1437060.1 hypothetical protein [Prevotella sp.]
MKILFIGDYSNLHACLASQMRKMGHNVTLISDRGGYQHTSADVALCRNAGKFGSIRYLIDVMRLWPELAGYDVVQLINPHFIKLKPGRLAYFYRELKRKNGHIGLTLCGNDHFFVKACVEGSFRFSEFRVGDERTPYSVNNANVERGWLRDDVKRYNELVYDTIDSAVAVLPEYYIASRKILGEKCSAGAIPIDLSGHPFRPRDFEGSLKVVVGMKPEMTIQKGTRLLLEKCKGIAERSGGNIVVEGIGGISYKEYLDKLSGADILIDQLYSYSPATNALDAMAMGLVAASGAEPEYYDLINEKALRPVIQLSPLIPNLEEHLQSIFYNKEELRRMSGEGRKLVERHNDVRKVVHDFIMAWER